MPDSLRELWVFLRRPRSAYRFRLYADRKFEVTNARCPAAAQLDDPTVLGYLRESFEFLGSARLHYCEICDEEWPVFDGEWPQSGVPTC